MEIDINKIVEALEKVVQDDIKNKERQWLGEDNEICKKCANLGWVIPYFIEDEDYNKLKLLITENEIIEFFKDYFEKENYKNVCYITQSIMENKFLINFQRPYLEAHKCFTNNNYIVTTITLIAVFEGICAEFILDNKEEKNIKGNVDRYFNQKYSNKEELTFNDREALKKFINSFFKSINFNEIDDSFVLNRNIIMHGRNFNNIGKLECMKMFNAIGVLVELLDLN